MENVRGQAAIMDAILFLMLTSILATTLFYFAAPYGQAQATQLNEIYLHNYASSTYKALLWAPVDTGNGFQNYLLATLKESFQSNSGQFGTDDLKHIAIDLNTLNKPVNASYDYLFAIYGTPNNSDFGAVHLIVYKKGDSFKGCTSPDNNLETFLNTVEKAVSTQSVITLNNGGGTYIYKTNGGGTYIYKTILIYWPKGANDPTHPDVCENASVTYSP